MNYECIALIVVVDAESKEEAFERAKATVAEGGPELWDIRTTTEGEEV